MLIDNVMKYSDPLKYKLTLCKSNKEPISVLKEVANINHTVHITNPNELVFSVPYYVDEKVNPNFNKVKRGLYLILLELIQEEDDTVFFNEYYTITNPNLQSDDVEVANIECHSLEQEINRKNIQNYKGVKKFYRTSIEIGLYTPSEEYPTLQDFKDSGILNYIISHCPRWKIGTVDDDVAAKYRDVQIDERRALDYIINDLQTSLDCIFVFDTINCEVNVKKFENVGNDNGLLISDKNYIKTVEQNIDFNDITTKLVLRGKDELSINGLNPTGNGYIIDLSYFRNSNNMGQSLLDALDDYDTLIASKEGEFQTLLSDLDNYTTQKNTLDAELVTLQGELNALETTRDSQVGEDLTDINNQISVKETEITNKENEINTAQTNIDNTLTSISDLREIIKMESNFTTEQIIELDPFIKQDTFRDTSYIDAQELYDDGLKILDRSKQPPTEILIGITDIYNETDNIFCQVDWDKIRVGDIVTLDYPNFEIDIKVRLIGYTHDDESNALELLFSNKTRLNDPLEYQAEIQRNSINSSTSLDINRPVFDTAKQTESAFSKYINNVLDLAAQKAVAGSNQNIEFGERGLICKDTTNDLEQIRILNNLIALTKDGFKTADVAISPDGINARLIRGLIGEFATLAANQIVVGGSGETLSNDVLGDEVVKTTEQYNSVSINSIDGVKAEHSDGSFTQMNGDRFKAQHNDGSYTSMDGGGLQRFVPRPIYKEIQTTNDNTEDFVGKTMSDLENDHWVLGYRVAIESNQLNIGLGSGGSTVTKFFYTTKDSVILSFDYKTRVDNSDYWVALNGNQTSLPQSSTFTQHTIDVPNKGWNRITWVAGFDDGDEPELIIDNVLFETNLIELNEIDYSEEGVNYNYITHIGEGTTDEVYTNLTDYPEPTIVQLPEEFKGKQFKVFLTLKNLTQGSSAPILDAFVNVISYNYDAGTFIVEGGIVRGDEFGAYGVKGIDFTYLAIY